MGFFRKRETQGKLTNNQYGKDSDKEPRQASFSKLKDNIDYLNKALRYSGDLKIRILENGSAALIYLESLVDQEKVTENIFNPVLVGKFSSIMDLPNGKQTENLEEVIPTLIRGHAVYIEDGNHKINQFNVTSDFNRQIAEPANERIIRGSHEGFVENTMININLVRKQIEHRDLTVRTFKLGKKTNVNLAMVYMDEITDPQLVRRVTERIKSITADLVLSPGYIEEYMEDSTFSPFPQMLNTERPDKAVANLMEGRIALFLEGSPTALILPSTFFMFYQSPDDYNSRWFTGTFTRLIRLASFLIAIGLPSFYIAVISFHFEVLPDDLIFPVKGSINEIAYPPIAEAFIMVIIIELIREAGIRLPQPIGQTIGIVGGLVIGDAIIRAGLVSNLMVIVVALTAIASFVVPSNEMSSTLRILTFPLIILAGALGFIGIAFGMLFLFIHLVKLESFGTPYFAPVAPLRFKDLKDTFVRLPLFTLKTRPKDAQPVRSERMQESREWKNSGKPTDS
ncbi:spore germination protein [Thalassobacillus hwangdonensis]|uniref:Spore germination protein n=1 Tax=Thalassobacillus hwangdonensis TaxID=546108 RepID=A0ABW3KXY2_9BACI